MGLNGHLTKSNFFVWDLIDIKMNTKFHQNRLVITQVTVFTRADINKNTKGHNSQSYSRICPIIELVRDLIDIKCIPSSNENG